MVCSILVGETGGRDIDSNVAIGLPPPAGEMLALVQVPQG
jgi:hypothetical protein